MSENVPTLARHPLAVYPQGERHVVPLPGFTLENGSLLDDYVLAFQYWGTPNPAGDNIILIEHALTGNSHVTGYLDPNNRYGVPWWDAMVGPGRAVDTDTWCVLACNTLGGCAGSTGPSSMSHDDAKTALGSRFPAITTRDMVTAEHALLEELGIRSLYAALGGSMGAARVLEWAIMYPAVVQRAFIVAISAKASAYMIGTQALQIDAIRSDPYWNHGDYYATRQRPSNGLKLARQIAHLTYRTPAELESRFSNNSQDERSPLVDGIFSVSSYLHHQADKLDNRFDAGSYVTLTHSLNTHDVSRGRGDLTEVLGNCQVPMVIGGIVEDQLFPIHEQRFIAQHVGKCHTFREIHSFFGHDGFLLEQEAIGDLLNTTLTIKV